MAYVFIVTYQGEKVEACWLHIPKCWGRSITEILAQSQENYTKLHDGHGHDLPSRWDYPLMFTGVREPVLWLRSFWGHRKNNKWALDITDTPWTTISRMTQPYQSDNFDDFARNVAEHLPGVIGWFFSLYTPPPVKVLRVEDEMFPFLESIGCSPGDVNPIGVNEGLPPINWETRDMIIMAEVSTFIRYGYKAKDHEATRYGYEVKY